VINSIRTLLSKCAVRHYTWVKFVDSPADDAAPGPAPVASPGPAASSATASRASTFALMAPIALASYQVGPPWGNAA